MTIGPCWPRVFMDGQGRKVAATVRGGSVFGGYQPVSRACGRGEGCTLDGCSRQPPGLRPCPHADTTLGAIGMVESGRVGSISGA